ncbi:MAG: hypothetical protein MK322_00740 [Pseudomonadales bacterium]|nr:hypothetical protein [Pseudomonadales bacterium]HAO55037.1 hypothetical protein [Gammaproteobacteria bacterium]|tara:strand:+ start:517 stop:1221 length:705 start_codon:yes stop_codon:yes gene_type:complete
MVIMYEETEYPLREELITAHAAQWERIGQPGAFWTAEDRVAFVQEARSSQSCDFCILRKKAMSPYAVTGKHTSFTNLPSVLIDTIHRIRTDPQRITRRMFDEVLASNYSREQYIELVSVVTSATIIDTLHQALGISLPETPEINSGNPLGQKKPHLVDEGAWVPLADTKFTLTDTGMPSAPNITRAMGCVPSAVELFFGTFRHHYALKNIPMNISQSQAEYVASRVSSINECFY